MASLTALAGALLLTLFSLQTLDGSWTLTLDTPRGPMDMPLVLKTDGETVTGSMTGPDGTEAPIKGTYTNDQLAFTVTINAPPGPIDLEMKGQVSGGDIAGSFSGGPISGSFTAKRAQ